MVLFGIRVGTLVNLYLKDIPFPSSKQNFCFPILPSLLIILTFIDEICGSNDHTNLVSPRLEILSGITFWHRGLFWQFSVITYVVLKIKQGGAACKVVILHVTISWAPLFFINSFAVSSVLSFHFMMLFSHNFLLSWTSYKLKYVDHFIWHRV